ncbi:MAG: Na/Pi cotransporter II-related protein [Candidatus Cloacimonetes bacterium HGW-Cloacimonetes-1]|jgi:phosphate:Na+ symporter|nr:MAG: Na/Pi cotransporter II-related protein [Candidatus Cloacimonetes bacterium HGW-Cloacimonetes-1]
MNFIDILNFFGSLALFLFGMTKMSDNLQAVAGNEMRRILKKLTNTPLRGVFVGIAVTGIIQSSSATSVMLIGLVNAGIMSLNQAVGVIMGANIGTTVTAQLIAFKLGDYAFAFIIIGVTLLLLKRSKSMEKWSQIILGFGLIFIGLNGMSSAVGPLKDSEIARSFMVNLSSNPITGILTGALFTMLIQSSSASIGIVIVLAMNQLIPFEGALYLVFGDNIGTTVTAWMAGIGANTTARRVAMVHTVFNVLGTIIFAILTYIGIYPKIINMITPGDILRGENIARHIANSHTLFNVTNTLLFLPFTGFLATLATRLIPQKASDTVSMGEPRHLNYLLVGNTELAIEQSIKEMREMLILVRKAFILSFKAFHQKNYRMQKNVDKIESAIDNLQKEITLYLVAVNDRSNSDAITKKIPALLHTVNDIEKLGDYAEEINKILNEQILTQKIPFHPEFMVMIEEIHGKMMYMLDLSIEYLVNFDNDYTYKIIEMEGRINQMHHDLRIRVMDQIQQACCDSTSGLNTIDYIDAIEMIADKMKNLVKAGSHKFVYDPLYERLPLEDLADYDDD